MQNVVVDPFEPTHRAVQVEKKETQQVDLKVNLPDPPVDVEDDDVMEVSQPNLFLGHNLVIFRNIFK